MAALRMSQCAQPRHCGMQTLQRPACRGLPAAATRSRQLQLTCRAQKVGSAVLDLGEARNMYVASDAKGSQSVIIEAWGAECP